MGRNPCIKWPCRGFSEHLLLRRDGQIVESSNNAQLSEIYSKIATLHKTHYERIVRYIALRIGVDSDPEDLASQVFEKALRSANSIRNSGEQLEAWIFRVAHNVAVSYLRNNRKRSRIPLEQLTEVLRSSEDISNAVEGKEQAEIISNALLSLSESQREVLALRFSDGLKAADIGRIMRKNPGAIREMQRAAIQKLKRAVTEELRDLK